MKNAESSIVMWGERGLVATMLTDFFRASKQAGWSPFLQSFNFPKPFWGETEPRSVSVVIEPDFSNEGFGHPDAILKFSYEGKEPAVLILEAKRLPYAKCCDSPSNRGGAGYNSTLNGQLELNHCLALALSTFTGEEKQLTEPEWILHSPYGSERRGKLRSLKNPVVVEEVVKHYAGVSFRRIYHLVVTVDPSDPFESPGTHPLWPELYHPDYPFRNCFTELRGQFAWSSWEKLEAALRRLDDQGNLAEGSFFLPTYEKNRKNFKASIGAEVAVSKPEWSDTDSELSNGEVMGPLEPSAVGRLENRGTRGATMIYAPVLNPKTFLHFSWRNESCAIRDYSQSPNIMPLEDRSKSHSMVRPKIVKEIFIRNREPISNTKSWHETTMNLNRTELPGLVKR